MSETKKKKIIVVKAYKNTPQKNIDSMNKLKDLKINKS